MSSRGYRSPPGHEVYDPVPLAAWVESRRRGAPIEGTRGLAARCGVGGSTLRRLLNGRAVVIRAEVAERIVFGLGGTIDDVFAEPPRYQHDMVRG